LDLNIIESGRTAHAGLGVLVVLTITPIVLLVRKITVAFKKEDK
jgi:hypothetical protein